MNYKQFGKTAKLAIYSLASGLPLMLYRGLRIDKK